MTHPRPDNGRPQHWTADTGQHDGLVPVPARVRVRELMAERHRVAMEFRERRAPMAERAARALLPIVSDRGERWPDSAAVMAALNVDADTLLATLRAGNRGRRCRHGRRLWKAKTMLGHLRDAERQGYLAEAVHANGERVTHPRNKGGRSVLLGGKHSAAIPRHPGPVGVAIATAPAVTAFCRCSETSTRTNKGGRGGHPAGGWMLLLTPLRPNTGRCAPRPSGWIIDGMRRRVK